MDIDQALRTLGLRMTVVDERSLQRAWRRFARVHHPDRCPGDPDAAARFAAGRTAYEALRGLTSPRGERAGRRELRVLIGLGDGILPAASAARARLYQPPVLGGREWTA